MSADHAVRPYAFDRVFAQSAIDATRNPQDLALQLHAIQAEMEQQRRDCVDELARARADGFQSGLAQANTEIAAQLLACEAALNEGLARLEVNFVETERRIAGSAAEIVMSAAELLAAQAIADRPGLAIDAALARVLTQTGFREALQVHVHPSAAEMVRTLLSNRQSAEQRPLTITIHEDVGLAPRDANILWDHGGLSLDAAARSLAVRDALGLVAPEALPAA